MKFKRKHFPAKYSCSIKNDLFYCTKHTVFSLSGFLSSRKTIFNEAVFLGFWELDFVLLFLVLGGLFKRQIQLSLNTM